MELGRWQSVLRHLLHFCSFRPMNKMILLSVFTACSLHVGAQKKIYYDKFFNTISENPTSYYRTFDDRDSVIRFTEFCGDSVNVKGYIIAGKHASLANDLVHFVKNNGNPYQFKKEFEGMRCELDCYSDNRPTRKMVSRAGKIYHAQ